MQLSILRLLNRALIWACKTRKIRVVEGVDVYVFTGRAGLQFDKRYRGLVTGEIIFVDNEESAYDKGLIAHELEHVRQFRKWKLLFPVLYFVEHFRVGYENNKYEIAARNTSYLTSGGIDK